MNRKRYKVNTQVEFNRFEFPVFLLLYICYTKDKESSLLYYLLTAGERIIEFIPFPRVLVLWEMQMALFRIWTVVVMSISVSASIMIAIVPPHHILLNLIHGI